MIMLKYCYKNSILKSIDMKCKNFERRQKVRRYRNKTSLSKIPNRCITTTSTTYLRICNHQSKKYFISIWYGPFFINSRSSKFVFETIHRVSRKIILLKMKFKLLNETNLYFSVHYFYRHELIPIDCHGPRLTPWWCSSMMIQ